MRRLDQILSSLGYCSRNEARTLVREERVLVKGEPVRDTGVKVNPEDVTFDDEPLDHPDGILVLMNKPVGLVCSHDGREGPAIYSLLPERWMRRNPTVTSIGRLDKETSGLILVTDQSALVHTLTSPKHKVQKHYLATLDRDLSQAEFERLRDCFAAGTLQLEDEKTPCAAAELQLRSPRQALLILTEGRYHQVRRMFAAMSFTVVALHRERFGAMDLGELKPGEWKHLPLDTFKT